MSKEELDKMRKKRSSKKYREQCKRRYEECQQVKGPHLLSLTYWYSGPTGLDSQDPQVWTHRLYFAVFTEP